MKESSVSIACDICVKVKALLEPLVTAAPLLLRLIQTFERSGLYQLPPFPLH